MNAIPQQIMREMRFSEEAIQTCTPTHRKISASKLCERILDYEEGIMPVPDPPTPPSQSRKTTPSKPQDKTPSLTREQIEKNTLLMLGQQRCYDCRKEERSQMSLNCGHIVYCESCVKEHQTCPICLYKITDIKKVYYS